MKHIKTLLFVLALLPLLVETVSAAEVRVITIGTGDGLVKGEHIWCGDQCRWNYEEGTVVHLKAEALDDSKFVGWLVNGQPHEGIITITQDMIVTAQFEGTTPPKDLVINWYTDRGVKREAVMVLDEVAILPERFDKWKMANEEELKAVTQKIIQRFHPQATVINPYHIRRHIMFVRDKGVFLKSPEAFTKEELLAKLVFLEDLYYVRYASPVFYTHPGDSSTRMALSGKIYVDFPDDYTEARITAIEEEYGLTRIRSDDDSELGIINYFLYEVGRPLEALEIANRLYESGQVDAAYPARMMKIQLYNFPNDEHLRNTGISNFDLNIPPDELTISWYSGEQKMFATIVLDEVALFFEKWKHKPQNDDEVIGVMDEIIHRYHPEARISYAPKGWYVELLAGGEIHLKRPEPFTKEQLPDILAFLKEHEHVRRASPVFYKWLGGKPWARMALTGEIYVCFPADYTEDQIHTIEAEYGLIKREAYGIEPNSFSYDVGDPMESLNIANHLYESGLVEASYPFLFCENEKVGFTQ